MAPMAAVIAEQVEVISGTVQATGVAGAPEPHQGAVELLVLEFALLASCLQQVCSLLHSAH